jgi:apolipoprotein N-acyltransferase
MQSFWRKSWVSWAGAALSAGLLELPFPLAGPMPAWRAVFAWVGVVPLLLAVLSEGTVSGVRPVRKSFRLSYLCGFLWYVGNCYWIYATMLLHGGLPPVVSALLLIAYSLVLGTYFGLFGLAVALVRQRSGSTRLALLAAPFFWPALELAAARITSVPWDQLGYSQVDNALVNQLAPWTGVYGISFLLVAVNALIAGGMLLPCCTPGAQRERRLWTLGGVALLALGCLGLTVHPAAELPTATAMLVQPNLDVAAENLWGGAEWDQHLAEFTRLAESTCTSSIAGIPQTGAAVVQTPCGKTVAPPVLVVWPEAPAPFIENESRFQLAMGKLARQTGSALIIGGIGVSAPLPGDVYLRSYNSAMIFSPAGEEIGRQDKIHLVPFGEYIPFKNLLVFARKLTGRVAEFSRGDERKVFLIDGRRYGVFICYEAVFADEVRHLAERGAEVLVNISDDGWYGDTSAPWQHLNMARMRAIENRRWILRDTNTGATAVIDPEGRVRQSIARHAVDVLPAACGFRGDITFYTAHGDVFAWLCALLSAGMAVWALRPRFLLELRMRIRA